ncbi:hypothetical protein ZWY2020_005828 [Hordeum vulgare]|nr:hypothetical protein ZWY2020_005828 [Hordeum vulgare]
MPKMAEFRAIKRVSMWHQLVIRLVATEKGAGSSTKNQTLVASPTAFKQNQTSGASSVESGSAVNNKEATPQVSAGSFKDHSSQTIAAKAGNHSEVLVKGNVTSTKQAGGASGNKKVDWIKEMAGCDLFHGNWVQDDCTLYPEDLVLTSMNPSTISMVAQTELMKSSGGNPVDAAFQGQEEGFEASGSEFKTEGSYSFLFTDYNCSVEFFRSPFLVQEWETRVSNGNKKETLRLDIVEQSSPKYKDAEFIIFNTGHWWTHEKTALGKDYYQEGSHIYSELNVVDAFHKALITWSRWIDANVNPKKTTVMFRGYSASHFSGGQWNSGGSCDKETEPIRNEQYLSTYPPKMSILEDVIHKMRTPVVYLNITRLTDYRKDAHPSIYRKQHLSEEERRSPERYQDCSHWCLPGVPDSWNELVYAQLLISQHQMLQH